jgi:hypothetical protein
MDQTFSLLNISPQVGAGFNRWVGACVREGWGGGGRRGSRRWGRGSLGGCVCEGWGGGERQKVGALRGTCRDQISSGPSTLRHVSIMTAVMQPHGNGMCGTSWSHFPRTCHHFASTGTTGLSLKGLC